MYLIGLLALVLGIGLLLANFAAAVYVVLQDKG